jgi:two-component system chemotaxis response regulator CheY
LKRIAIIDDDEIFQFTTRVRLEKLENIQEILSFEDGERAYDYLCLGENLPDVILLDINMPIVDGWDFFRVV